MRDYLEALRKLGRRVTVRYGDVQAKMSGEIAEVGDDYMVIMQRDDAYPSTAGYYMIPFASINYVSQWRPA